MNLIFSLFIFSLVLGQAGGIVIRNGVYLYLHDILLIICLGAAAVKIIKTKKFRTNRNVSRIIIVALALSIGLWINPGHLNNSQILTSLLYLFRWLAYAGVYVIIIQKWMDRNKIINALYAVGIVFSLLGIIQYLTYSHLDNLMYLGWDPHFGRLFSTFLDPNFASAFIVLSLLISLYMWNNIPRHIGASVIFLHSVALVLTYSRSGILALVTGVVFWSICVRKRIILVILLICASAFFLIPKSSFDVIRLTRTVSTVSRIENYANTLRLIEKSPLFGYGFNSLRFVTASALGTSESGFLSRAGAGIDNSILFILATGGFIGFGAFIYLASGFFQQIRVLYRHANYRPMFTLLVSSFAAILVHSFFNNTLFYAWVLIWLWILLGVSED